ncbi:MAG: DUF1853 family protein [Winogradskyella arenosi]
MKPHTELQFKGCINTPALFATQFLDPINAITLPSKLKPIPDAVDFKQHRLGKLVEEFVFYQLQQEDSIDWIIENVQIQNGKQTIGELDALYYENNQPIHLEVVYKFYLYDRLNTYDNPLEYWIGPNRNDRLSYKLDKLKTKQFPLLYKEETQVQLNSLGIEVSAIKQRLCFQAQLFLPYGMKPIETGVLNSECISGFYIPFADFNLFRGLKLYIPRKLDWLVNPHDNVDWLDYDTAKAAIELQIKDKRSPLIWLKRNSTTFEKCFITFW